MRIHYTKDIWDTDNSKKTVYIEGTCDSTETKPVDGIADGSIITESDTGNVYMFNENSETWGKMFSLKAVSNDNNNDEVEA